MKRCNLCGFPIIRINKTVFGTRCIKCRSSFIHRAMGVVLSEANIAASAKVHEFSNHGAIYKYLKKRFTNLTTSEYFEGVNPGEYKNGIQCQDIQQLTLPDCTYDLMTSTEVFEHVPDDIKGYKEVLRCLKGGGSFIFTVPIEDKDITVERARLQDGEIIHMLEPEYHGDHLREKGIICFRNYGYDIADRLKKVGFSEVLLIKIEDEKHLISPMKIVVKAKKA